MRVLENKVTKEVEKTCKKCKSVLAVTASDVTYHADALEPHESTVSFTCCQCGEENSQHCLKFPIDWWRN